MANCSRHVMCQCDKDTELRDLRDIIARLQAEIEQLKKQLAYWEGAKKRGKV